ncbi:phosphoribosyltransferase [Defluviimonas sp. SAOS-178_SWC]|uniref:phosphoribosyltransferase n=1 Tax=Defluviimonas sp. SAOS-178_SWC TaxID=3121287 RepID=UPI003221DC4D
MQGYRDRVEAGKAVADLVARHDYSRPVVLALPRGGVPVAAEVARVLGAPLDLVMVRKIGVPSQPELAAAAVVDGARPELVVNDEIARHAGLSRADLDRLAEGQLEVIRRRRQTYLKDRKHVDLKDRTAIVVDDGIATGATMRAALKAVRRQGPARVVLAVPVAAPDSLAALRGEVDDIICPTVPAFLGAIGAFYQRFDQTSDDEVIRLLAAAPPSDEP